MNVPSITTKDVGKTIWALKSYVLIRIQVNNYWRLIRFIEVFQVALKSFKSTALYPYKKSGCNLSIRNYFNKNFH